MPRPNFKSINNAAIGILIEVAYAAAIMCAGLVVGLLALWWLR